MIANQPRFSVRVSICLSISIVRTYDSRHTDSQITVATCLSSTMRCCPSSVVQQRPSALYMTSCQVVKHAKLRSMSTNRPTNRPKTWRVEHSSRDHDLELHMTVCTGTYTIFFWAEGPFGSSFDANNVPRAQSHRQARVKAGAGGCTHPRDATPHHECHNPHTLAAWHHHRQSTMASKKAMESGERSSYSSLAQHHREIFNG